MDLLSRIQQRARLHGPKQTRRAVHATLVALAELLPEPVFRHLTAGLPAELRGRPRPADSAPAAVGRRAFLTRIAHQLVIDEPAAAFIARAVFEQLNATGNPITPAAVAHLVPADLRPLLNARMPGVTTRPTVVSTLRRSTRVSAAGALLRHRRASPSANEPGHAVTQQD